MTYKKEMMKFETIWKGLKVPMPFVGQSATYFSEVALELFSEIPLANSWASSLASMELQLEDKEMSHRVI